MAAPKAPVIGGAKEDAALEERVFAAEVKPHLVHETVRAELNARRSGTKAVKTRGLVAGGRSKPWRQKGTGRARAGTTRAVHWTGGSVAFDPRTQFDVKVNRKARRAALRGALTSHAAGGTLALVDGSAFEAPSTRRALEVLADWGKAELPLLVVAAEDEVSLIKSFRNLERVTVTVPQELEVAHIVGARTLIVSRAALPLVEGRAG
jgi:large subunit ribosomal protein L4